MHTPESQTDLCAEGAAIKQAMEGNCHLNQLEALTEVLEHVRGGLATASQRAYVSDTSAVFTAGVH